MNREREAMVTTGYLVSTPPPLSLFENFYSASRPGVADAHKEEFLAQLFAR